MQPPSTQDESRLEIRTELHSSIDKAYIVSDGHTEYFMKILAPNDSCPDNCTEVDIACRISHPNIMRAYRIGGRCERFSGMRILYPVADCDLLTYIKTKTVSADTRLKISYKILSAVSYLHSQGILHLDIKPDNVMMNGDEPLLIDFGSARVTANMECMIPPPKAAENYITPEYRPPELTPSEYRYGWYSDVWSLAYVIVFILAGTRMYPVGVGMGNHPQIRGWTRSNFSNPIAKSQWIGRLLHRCGLPQNVHAAMVQMVCCMTDLDPSKRPLTSNLLLHTVWGSCRTNMVGQVSYRPPITYSPLSASSDVTEIINFFRSELPDVPVQALFLAVDLYYRSCNSARLQDIKQIMCAVCCIAVSCTYSSDKSIRSLMQVHFDCRDVLPWIEHVIMINKGVLQPNYLFAAARGVDHMKYIIKKYFTNPTGYTNVDLNFEARNPSFPRTSKMVAVKHV